MNEDMADFAKSCRTCQVQTNLIHTHPISLQNIVTPWPLHTWGLVNPPSGRDNWILEPIDYFSKWVEAIPFRKATSTIVANFIHKHIITRFRALLNQVLLFYTLLFSRKWASGYHQSHVAYFDQDDFFIMARHNPYHVFSGRFSTKCLKIYLSRSNLKSNREQLTHREVQRIICCRFYNRHNMS